MCFLSLSTIIIAYIDNNVKHFSISFSSIFKKKSRYFPLAPIIYICYYIIGKGTGRADKAAIQEIALPSFSAIVIRVIQEANRKEAYYAINRRREKRKSKSSKAEI